VLPGDDGLQTVDHRRDAVVVGCPPSVRPIHAVGSRSARIGDGRTSERLGRELEAGVGRPAAGRRSRRGV